MGVKIGDVVDLLDETGHQHRGLITQVWGPADSKPSINVVFVSLDETKTDQYGRQVERLSSLQHQSTVGKQPGRFWWSDDA